MRDTAQKQALDFKIYMNGVDVELDKQECEEVLQAIEDTNAAMMAACWGLTRSEVRKLVNRCKGVKS